jgi:folylpolyglutamate synthase/dihydropteroate synthase
LAEPVNPLKLGDVVRKIAREEAQKAVPQRPPISPIQMDNPLTEVRERIAKLETRVAELEKKSHNH